MKSVVVFRHVHFEDLGSLGDVLAQRGAAIDYREAGISALDDAEARGADLLVVLGGPIGAYEVDDYPFLAEELAVLRHRLERRLPVLGICLGAQLMARAMGAAVYPSGVKEIGWKPVTLTEAGEASALLPLRAGAPVLHWHGDTFDLPAGAALLASSDLVQNQAFAIGDHALGLQFHLEATVAGFERWLIGHACEIAATPGVSVTQLRDGKAAHGKRLEKVGATVFETWLKRCWF